MMRPGSVFAALRAAHVPPVYGFVNGVHLAQEPDSAPVLALWRQAGFPLGNHTWSHINLNQHTVEEYGTEVLRNEPLLGETMRGEDWHWFRYPYLAEGDTPEKRAAIPPRTFHERPGSTPSLAGRSCSAGAPSASRRARCGRYPSRRRQVPARGMTAVPR